MRNKQEERSTKQANESVVSQNLLASPSRLHDCSFSSRPARNCADVQSGRDPANTSTTRNTLL